MAEINSMVNVPIYIPLTEELHTVFPPNLNSNNVTKTLVEESILFEE